MSKRQRDVSAKTVSSCVFWIASSGFGTSLTVRNLVNGHALTSADFMPTELVLLIILAGLTFTGLLRRQRKANVLEGEILQPERRALPDRSRVKRLLLAAVPVLVASTAHADDWQQRAKEAVHANDADTANADREGFWVGHNYYWPDRDYYYNKWRRAYFSLDRSVPTMADAPSWLRYPAKPQWRVISRSRRR